MNSIDHCLKEKMIKLMKDELGGKILTNLLDQHDGREDKKAKGTKKCVIKRKLTFQNRSDKLK